MFFISGMSTSSAFNRMAVFTSNIEASDAAAAEGQEKRTQHHLTKFEYNHDNTHDHQSSTLALPSPTLPSSFTPLPTLSPSFSSPFSSFSPPLPLSPFSFSSSSYPRQSMRSFKGGEVKEKDVWSLLRFDDFLSKEEVNLRMKVRRTMEMVEPSINQMYEKAEFSMKFIEICKTLGPAGLQINEFGCPGMSTLESMLMVMEMCRIDASLATFYMVHSALAMKSIDVGGSFEQKKKWLPLMASLDLIGAFALTEANYGSHATGIQTNARRVNGGWVLNGSKRWIGNGTFADVIIVWAKNLETSEINGFIVEKGIKGFLTKKIEKKISLRILQNADIILKDCFVTDDCHLKHAYKFADGTQKVLESSRALVAAAAAGSLLGAVDKALKYCVKRTQFNRPLASFQLVQERLMRAMGLVNATVLMALNLARMMDKGPVGLGLIALCKGSCSLLSREGVSLCREVLGGNGILLEFGVARAFMDIEGIYTYEGTYDINMLIAGRSLTGINALL